MTPLVALTVSVTLGASLWPFGARQADAPDRATIGRLPERELALDHQPAAGSAELAMHHYREFLALSEGRPELRAEALRRLGDLNLDAGIEAQTAGTRADDGAALFAEAVTLYTELLDHHPGQADVDRILYQLARAHDGAGDPGQSLAVLDRLVAGFPASVHLDEAQFRRGERLFVLQDYPAAERAYAAVLAVGESSPFFEQSLYKLGWSRFKLGQHEEGQAPFLDLLDRRLAGTTPAAVARELAAMSRPEQELVTDTLRVLSITFSYLEGPGTIDQALAARVDTPYGWLLYQSLGELYLEQERFRDAAEAFDAFASREPVHPQAPLMQQAVIDAYIAGRFPSLVLEAKQDYVTRYGLDTPFWQVHAAADHPLVLDQLRGHLGDLAEHDHSLAQQSHDAADYERAAGWYRRFLAWFPQDEAAPGRSFLLGELLFEAGRHAEATAAYLASAYDYGAHPQAAEAGYAALLAAREHEAQLEGAERAAWHAGYTEHALRFATTFSEHPEAVPVLTTVAEDLFASRQLERALEVAGLVVTHQPPAPPGLERVAWTVIAHSQFDRERYAEAEQAYLRLRQLPLEDGLRGEVDTRIAASIYRQAEQARDRAEVDAAVGHFLRLGDSVPGAEIRPNALYDAAALLSVSERYGESAALLRRFRAEFPQHALAGEVTRNLAVALESDGQHAAAADEFERIADSVEATADTRRAALWQAAGLHQRAGQPARERAAYRQIVERFPQPATEALEARQKLVELAAAAGDDTDRLRWLESIVIADRELGAARTERSRSLAALAALELAHPRRDDFRAISLTLPLDQSLKAKRSRMELALSAYGQAADYGVAEVVTAATHEIAELYYRLSQDLLASERPRDLDEEALEQYELLLEEQVFPFEEQAIDLYLVNTARAAEGVFDRWVQASFARLASLSPARYARTERREHVVLTVD